MTAIETSQVAQQYNSTPYPSYPYPNTQAERLYTIGKLFGMQPVDFKSCKVLELGCASGGNLIPMASLFPESTFVGVDISSVQIQQGQEQINALKLNNITLKNASITEINAKFGKFDYIIAHGVFSWVSKDIQDKIFEIFSKNLNKNGIAYVSYSTLPGWNLVKSIREMILFHTKDLTNPAEKVRQARLLLKFITEAHAGNKNAYAQEIADEVAVLDESEDSYILHGHLAENNEAFYFHQVVQKASEAGLQYLGDTGIASMFPGNFTSQTAEILLQAADDVVKVEQYMDFIRNRRFRSSLFCSKDIALNRNLTPECLEDFYILSQINVDENLLNANLTSRAEVAIKFANGAVLQTSNPSVILAIKILAAQNGKPIATKELLNKFFDTAGGSINKELARASILEQFLRLVLADAIGIFSSPGKFTNAISEKPMASELARLQAANNFWITNQRLEKNNIDLFNRVLIQYLDGTNDFDSILQKMARHVENEDLSLSLDGQKISDKGQLMQILRQITRQNIDNLAPSALLVA
jgi:SAM-dependent methyltransferase